MSQKESEWKKEVSQSLYRANVGIAESADIIVLFDQAIATAVSNREKEIAEEVEGSVYAAFFSEAGEDDFEEYNNWRKNVLPGIILKH